MRMTDREKVIDELNTDVLPFLQHHCDMQCDREKRWISKMIITVHDALALLKEQEAVEPEVEVLNEIDRIYRCPKCHKCFFYEKQKYCDQCGQEVQWE
jgi:hypothetical protein